MTSKYFCVTIPTFQFQILSADGGLHWKKIDTIDAMLTYCWHNVDILTIFTMLTMLTDCWHILTHCWYTSNTVENVERVENVEYVQNIENVENVDDF